METPPCVHVITCAPLAVAPVAAKPVASVVHDAPHGQGLLTNTDVNVSALFVQLTVTASEVPTDH